MEDENTTDVVDGEDNDKNVTNEHDKNDENDKNVTQDVEITDKNMHSSQDTTTEQISQAIFDGKPLPSEHVVAGMAEEAKRMITDTAGVQFDPEKHAADTKGEPVYYVRGVKKGQFRPARKKGLTKTSDKYHAGMTEPSQAGIMLAGAFLTMTQTIGFALGGPEESKAWKPQNEMEQLMIDNAFVNYATAKELKDMPPTFGLIFAITMFSLPRLTRPQPRTKIKSGAKSAFKWLSKKFKKGGKNAQHDTRPDNEREDGDRQDTGA